ncbi:MAG: hypothetical protein KGZ85_08080 [Ignavibacterium sp.]|nr:hypothetical protein [Ignavibacterium sp.]
MSVKAVVKINDVDVSSYVYNSSLIQIVNRNRDYSPVFEGMRLSLSSAVPNEPLKNQEVLITVNDTQDVFLGIIKDIRFNQSLSLWELEIDHYLLQLENFLVQHADLHNDFVLESINDDATWNEFTVNTTDNYLVRTDHGLSDGDKIVLKSSDTLPAPLVNTNRYYVKKINDDNVKLYEDMALLWDNDALNFTNDRHVNITNSGTGTHSFSLDLDNKKYNDWSFYRDIKYSKGTTNQFYSQLIPNNNVYPMQLNYPQNSDKEEYNLIVFDTDGTLPTGLSKDRAYIAAYENLAGGWFQIYANWTDYVNDNAISPGATGSDQQWFSVLRRKSGDADLWTSMPTAIIQLKFFVETVFKKIGVTLDTTEIDTIIQYRYTTEFQSYKWDDIYLMECLLYNVDQSKPVYHSDVITDTTCLELIQDIFQRLGITIRLKDASTKEYELLSQKKDEFGRIRPEIEAMWVIEEKYSDDYNEKDLIDTKRGWFYSHPLVSVFQQEALSFIYNNRRFKEFEQYLERHLRLNDSDGQQMSDFSVRNNLVFFLYDKFETNGAYNVRMLRDGAVLDGTEMLLNPNYSPSQNALMVNSQYALLNHTREEISFRLELLDQDIYTVKELWLDIKKDLIRVVQEINQLVSG